MDPALYAKIDAALVAMDAAFHRLMSAGLAREEEEESTQSAECLGAPVLAKEIGLQATQALDAIRRLKLSALPADWKTRTDYRERVRVRLELDMTKISSKLTRFKQETQNLVQATENALVAGAVVNKGVD